MASAIAIIIGSIAGAIGLIIARLSKIKWFKCKISNCIECEEDNSGTHNDDE